MTVTVTNPYTDHRIGHWKFIEKHGVTSKRDPLLRLRDHWRELNLKFYGSSMIEPYILLNPPSGTRAWGDTSSVGAFGEPMEIRLRPSLLNGTHPKVHGDLEGCFRFVADVLMHEMIHQWQREVAGNDEESYHGHGSLFCAKANEIGGVLGLRVVVVRNRKGSKLPRCAQWPHNVRPLEYYLGAYDPDGGTPDPGEGGPDVVPQKQIPCQRCHGAGTVPQ